MDLYNLKASYYDKDVSMIKESTLMHKTVRRQVTARSVRNCMTQICAVAYSHYVPCVDRYEHKPGIMKGSTELMKLVQKITRTFVQPVKKENIMNTDMTSMYYYAGVAHDDRKSHRWARVGKENLEYDCRNRSSAWKDTKKLESSCQGLRVKFGLGSSASGSLFPTVIVYSGLSEEEMPDDDFYVCPIPGLTINAHLDIRNADPGYVCFMRSGCKQIRFFDWYEKMITIPTIMATRVRYQGFGEQAACNVSPENNTVIWGDSDIPYLQQLSDPI